MNNLNCGSTINIEDCITKSIKSKVNSTIETLPEEEKRKLNMKNRIAPRKLIGNAVEKANYDKIRDSMVALEYNTSKGTNYKSYECEECE